MVLTLSGVRQTARHPATAASSSASMSAYTRFDQWCSRRYSHSRSTGLSSGLDGGSRRDGGLRRAGRSPTRIPPAYDPNPDPADNSWEPYHSGLGSGFGSALASVSGFASGLGSGFGSGCGGSSIFGLDLDLVGLVGLMV